MPQRASMLIRIARWLWLHRREDVLLWQQDAYQGYDLECIGIEIVGSKKPHEKTIRMLGGDWVLKLANGDDLFMCKVITGDYDKDYEACLLSSRNDTRS